MGLKVKLLILILCIVGIFVIFFSGPAASKNELYLSYNSYRKIFPLFSLKASLVVTEFENTNQWQLSTRFKSGREWPETCQVQVANFEIKYLEGNDDVIVNRTYSSGEFKQGNNFITVTGRNIEVRPVKYTIYFNYNKSCLRPHENTAVTIRFTPKYKRINWFEHVLYSNGF